MPRKRSAPPAPDHPEVRVLLRDGLATLSIADPDYRLQVLTKLLEHTPAGVIETLTRSGPHVLYRLPEGNARAAGVLDTATVVGWLPGLHALPGRADSGYAQSLADAFRAPRP